MRAAPSSCWTTPGPRRSISGALDFGVDITIHAATKYPAGHSDILLGTVSANAACWEKLQRNLQHARLLRRSGRCLPGAAGPQDDGRAARTAPEERARNRALAGTAGRRRARPPSGARKPSGPRALEARFFRLQRAVFGGVGRRRAEGRARLPRCARHLRARPFLGRLREPGGTGLAARPHDCQGPL